LYQAIAPKQDFVYLNRGGAVVRDFGWLIQQMAPGKIAM
jgi:hypothetical protein